MREEPLQLKWKLLKQAKYDTQVMFVQLIR